MLQQFCSKVLRCYISVCRLDDQTFQNCFGDLGTYLELGVQRCQCDPYVSRREITGSIGCVV